MSSSWSKKRKTHPSDDRYHHYDDNKKNNKKVESSESEGEYKEQNDEDSDDEGEDITGYSEDDNDYDDDEFESTSGGFYQGNNIISEKSNNDPISELHVNNPQNEIGNQLYNMNNPHNVLEPLGVERETITGYKALPNSLIKRSRLKKHRLARSNFVKPNSFAPLGDDHDLTDRCKLCVLACSGMLFLTDSSTLSVSDSLTTGNGILNALNEKYNQIKMVVGESERYRQLARFWNEIIDQNIKSEKKTTPDVKLDEFMLELSSSVPTSTSNDISEIDVNKFHITEADVFYHFTKCQEITPDQQDDASALTLHNLRNHLEKNCVYITSRRKPLDDEEADDEDSTPDFKSVSISHTKLLLMTINTQFKINNGRRNVARKADSEITYNAFQDQKERFKEKSESRAQRK